MGVRMTIFDGQKACKEFFDITKIQPWKFKDNVMMAATGKFQLDIITFDNYLALRDADYSNEKCTYKEHKDVSLSKYLTLKWGERANQIIDEMIK